jgi:hypothetical protein
VITVFKAATGQTAGAAVQLSGRWLLTCAHVVNDALGRPHESVAAPADAAVEVAFSALPDAGRRQARVRHWIPRRAGAAGSIGWQGDLAVLELREDPPLRERALAWREMAAGQHVVAWYGSGQEFSYAKVEVGSCDGPLGFLDGDLAGAAIGPGYSGGPLCLADGTAVGLVMAHIQSAPGAFSPQDLVRRGIGIPWQTVRAELAAAGRDDLVAGAGEYSAPGRPTSRDVRPATGMEEPLAALLGEPVIRADRAGQLAERYGLTRPKDGSAPTYKELAAFLLEHPRGMADLTEIHAPTLTTDAERAALYRLIGLGHGEGFALLLSSGEHRELLARLGELSDEEPALLPRAVRGALPYVHLPAVLRTSRLPAGALGEATEILESFGGDSAGVPYRTPRVPALLRVVEYLAVLTGADRSAALRSWNDRVARRLGIPGPALAERRQDAAEWAARQREAQRPTVIVELDRREEDPAGHYRCAVWRTRPDGSPARLDTGPERPLPGWSIAALIRDAADALGGGTVLVEVWVDAEHLQLPVDEWDDAGQDADLPTPLGEEYHVVLRCRTTRRNSSALERRWAARMVGEPLVVDGRSTDPRSAVVRLKKERDCGRVVIHGPRAHRDAMLRACLVLGVPVVLWDRDADGYDHAPRLDPVRPTGPLDGLPERVRRFRVDTYADRATYPARPTLVWEDPGRPMPDGLWLADPEGPEV